MLSLLAAVNGSAVVVTLFVDGHIQQPSTDEGDHILLVGLAHH
jgi:hypothetical protein